MNLYTILESKKIQEKIMNNLETLQMFNCNFQNVSDTIHYFKRCKQAGIHLS